MPETPTAPTTTQQLAAIHRRQALLLSVLLAMDAAAERQARLFSCDELDIIDAIHVELRTLSTRASALRRAQRPRLTFAPRPTLTSPAVRPTRAARLRNNRS